MAEGTKKQFIKTICRVCACSCLFIKIAFGILGSVISFLAVAQDASQLVQDSEYVRGVKAFADGDFEQAAEFWLADAYRGAADAQFNLGVLYIEGKGLPVDRSEAVFWFEKAANQGHPEAQYSLGHLLLEQTGDVEKIRQGIEWWRKSAEAGFAVAQYNYGRALYYGVGVDESRPQAKSWFEKSASGGNIKAEQFLARNANNFTDDPVPTRLTEPTVVGASVAAGAPGPPPSIAEVEASEYVLVKDQPILMYSRFNTFSPIITRVGAKILLRVVARKRNWILAEVPGGVPGWLQNDQMKSFESDKAEIVVDTATVYADPTENTEANDIGKLLRGSKPLLLEQQPEWSRIQLPEKIPGWIEADQVDIVDASPEEIAKVWQSQRIKQSITALASREIKIASAAQQRPTTAIKPEATAAPKTSAPELPADPKPTDEPKQEQQIALAKSQQPREQMSPAELIESQPDSQANTSLAPDQRDLEDQESSEATSEELVEASISESIEEKADQVTASTAPDSPAVLSTESAAPTETETIVELEPASNGSPATDTEADTGPQPESESKQQATVDAPQQKIVVAPRKAGEEPSQIPNTVSAENTTEARGAGQKLAEGVAGQSQSASFETIKRTGSEDVPVRAGPDQDDPQIIVLPRNTLVDIVGEQRGFAEVTVPGGVPVWVPESDVRLRENDVIIEANRVRARLGPGGKGSNPEGRRVLGLIPQGSVLKLVQKRDDWVRITAPEWITGWVESSALEIPRVRQGLDRIWRQQAITLQTHYAGQDLVELAVVPTLRDANLTGTGVDNDNAWLFESTSRMFTLQLFSMQNRSSARSLFASLNSRGQFFSTMVNGDRWYFMLLGKFLTPEAAEAVAAKLPRWASGARVRSFVRLQVNRCKKRESLSEEEARGLDQMCRD